jgi:DNA-binding response OmpR family regulator
LKKRILIAEDDKSILSLEKRILEDAGYEVDCAETGDLALDMARQNRYTVVIADVMMPGLDGYDLTKEITKIYQRSVPVLLVTAVHDALKAAHQRDAKPMSTLEKPFSPQALLTAVRLLEGQAKAGGPSGKAESASRAGPDKPARKRSWFDKLLHPADPEEKKRKK